MMYILKSNLQVLLIRFTNLTTVPAVQWEITHEDVVWHEVSGKFICNIEFVHPSQSTDVPPKKVCTRNNKQRL